MSISIRASAFIHKDGSVTRDIKIADDQAGNILVSESATATGPNEQPTLARVATIAIERLARLYHEAKARLTEHGLIEKPAPSEGPYR